MSTMRCRRTERTIPLPLSIGTISTSTRHGDEASLVDTLGGDVAAPRVAAIGEKNVGIPESRIEPGSEKTAR
ncbi:MAG: hypothetical protein WD688_15480 [Candidatus Binatia bacterium]